MTALILTNTGLLMQGISRGGALWFKEAIPPPAPSKGTMADLYEKWFLIGSLIRFSVSGNLGVVCFYVIERFLYRQLSRASSLPAFVDEYKDSVSYFFGYLIQIVTQHLLNAFLVYGLDTIDTREKYIKTLLGQFSVYGLSLVGSTILNLFLLNAGLERSTAFFSTMIVFAVVNYFLIQWVVRKTTDEIEEKAHNRKRPWQRILRGGSTPPPYMFGGRTERTETTVIFNSHVPVDARNVNGQRLELIRKCI